MNALVCFDFGFGVQGFGFMLNEGYLALWNAQLQTGANADADVPRG